MRLHLPPVSLVGLEIRIVMTRIITWTATMMVETVVDPTLTHGTALIANAWIQMGMVEQAAGEVRQQVDPWLQLVQQINLLQVASQVGVGMDFAMMSITMWTAVMMVETVVDPMLTHNTALNANALILMEVAEE